jgi:hypothetical protein
MSIYGPALVWDASLWRMGSFEGSTAMRGFIEDWRVAYQEFENELEEFRPRQRSYFFSVPPGRPCG